MILPLSKGAFKFMKLSSKTQKSDYTSAQIQWEFSGFFFRSQPLSKATTFAASGNTKGVVSLYHWPPIWLVWNQLYGNCPFLFLLTKQNNPNQTGGQWYNDTSPFSIPWLHDRECKRRLTWNSSSCRRPSRARPAKSLTMFPISSIDLKSK